MKETKPRLTVLVLMLAIVVAACGGGDATEDAATTLGSETTTAGDEMTTTTAGDDTTTTSGVDDGDTTGELRAVTVMIDGAAVPYYVPFYVADDRGYFADQGLDVTFIYAPAADIITNIAAGNAEFGFPNGDTVIAAAANEVPVRVVHTTYQHGIGAVLFKTSSGIESPADLAGKTVAITDFGSPNYIQLQVMLKEVGLTLDDVNVEIIGSGAIVDTLKTDQVDAIIFSRLRYYNLVADGVEVGQILSDDYLPSHGNVVIAGASLVENDPELIGAFLTAFEQGLNDVISGDTLEAVEMSMEKYTPSFSADPEVIARIIDEVYAGYLWQTPETEANGLGYAGLESWQATADILLEYGIIPGAVEVDTFVLEPSMFRP